MSAASGSTSPGPGIVYTETVVFAAPEQFVADAPYQLAIISLESGNRLTARIAGPRVRIGDSVAFAEYRDGIPFFRKLIAPDSSLSE